MILVIVESPSKCCKIQHILGEGYKVIATCGHIVELNKLENINMNTFECTYEQIESKQHVIKELKKQIRLADVVLLATDGDREGEKIAYNICEVFGLSMSTTMRLVFNEISETAIKNALNNMCLINMQLVKAQEARQILDLLIGFKISPLLWKYLSFNKELGLSAGRCQTPALRLIYENYLENEKKKNKIETMYNVFGYFGSTILKFQTTSQIMDKTDLKAFFDASFLFEFKFLKKEKQTVDKLPPEPLTTSKLQQLCGSLYHWSPKDTMYLAQQLYEQGFITYMRTDAKRYSDEFIQKIKQYISNKYGEHFINPLYSNVFVNNKQTNSIKVKKSNVPKFTQEAHESIRPVYLNADTSKIQDKRMKMLYYLINKVTIQSCLAPSRYSQINAKIVAPMGYMYSANFENCLFKGWEIVNDLKEQEQMNENTKRYNYVDCLENGCAIGIKMIEAKISIKGEMNHLNETNLVSLLEEKGIGRPSTYASIVEKIQNKHYVKKQDIEGIKTKFIEYVWNSNNTIEETEIIKEIGKESNKLVLQPLGYLAIEFLLKTCDNLFEYTYTRDVEEILDLISKNEYDKNKLCNDVLEELTKIVNDKTKKNKIKKFEIKLDDDHSLVAGQHGLVIKEIEKIKDAKDKIKFISVNNDAFDLIRGNKELSDWESTIKYEESLGAYNNENLFVKQGKYGMYAEWGNNRCSLKGVFKRNEKITYSKIVDYLNKVIMPNCVKKEKNVVQMENENVECDDENAYSIGENSTKNSKQEKKIVQTNAQILRDLSPEMSIRTGLYGDYVYYKTNDMKMPKFINLKKISLPSEQNIITCDSQIIIDYVLANCDKPKRKFFNFKRK